MPKFYVKKTIAINAPSRRFTPLFVISGSGRHGHRG